jgi:hypothetical protein
MKITPLRRLTRYVSPTLFAGIVLAFALPFATVSCEGGDVHTTGLQLATWTVPDGHPHATTDDGESLVRAIEHRESIWALLTLITALAGFACGVARRKGEAKATVVGLVFVLAMWWGSMVFADVQYGIGFVLVSLGFPALVVWHASLAFGRRHRRRREERLTASRPGPSFR